MAATENLKKAVDDEIAAGATGFETIGSAMEELTADIAALPAAADVDAEAARLAENSRVISEAFNTASQAIRDAIPTDVATPVVE